tara:strand:+ start:1848 stop:2954 length:1107 start_codon:yes stop_codon:yes gene_type:complete
MPRPDLASQLITLTDSTEVYTQFGSGVIRYFDLLQLKGYILAGSSQYAGLNGVTFNAATGEIVIDDGVNASWAFTVPDVDPVNEFQTLTIDPTTGAWTLSDGGGAGDLNDGISWNTGTNTLTMFGTALDLSGAGTDNQVLSVSGTNLELTSEDGTDIIDLTPYISGVFNVADETAKLAITGQSVGAIAIVADADGAGNKGVSWWTGLLWTPTITFQDKPVINSVAVSADILTIVDPQRGDVALVADSGGGSEGISFHDGAIWTTVLTFGGDGTFNVFSISDATLALDYNIHYFVDAAISFSIPMPAATGKTGSWISFTITNITPTTEMTLTPVGVEALDGFTTDEMNTLHQYKKYISNGVSWYSSKSQ